MRCVDLGVGGVAPHAPAQLPGTISTILTGQKERENKETICRSALIVNVSLLLSA